MSSELRETERKTYLSYFNDGLAEILGGLPILSFGLGMVFGETMFFIFNWMPIILFWPLKRALTFPRMGYVKFSPERQRKISKNLVYMVLAGVASLLLGIFVFMGAEGEVLDLRDFMNEYGLLLFGAVMASAFALIALLFEVRRFYGYAALIFGSWLLAHLLDIDPGVPVAGAGAIIVLIGLWLLVNFLRRYPLPRE